ncbi:MAG: hypothetical protein AB7V77_02965 [Candidatus Woesearchaeota archaeon]
MNFKNKPYFIALKNLIIFSAIIHMCLILVYSILTKDISFLNYFNIIGLNLFFPEIVGSITQIFSFTSIIILFLIMYRLESLRGKKNLSLKKKLR